MNSGIARILTAGVAALIAAPGIAQDESTNRVAAETDWSVFVENDPSQACWAVSQPKESTATNPEGRVIAVRRGDILMFISYLPGQNVAGQISLTGGYPYRDGSNVTVQIGDDSFALITVPEDDEGTPDIAEDEYAWSASNEDDAAMIAAMKAGTTAVVTAQSQRGNTTKDSFSLLGFTAAVDQAAARCTN